MDGVDIIPVTWATGREDLMAVRFAVFVDEQGVPPALEADADDDRALHLLARTPAGIGIGTARLLPNGHIGRMAVLPDWRRRGIGGRLLDGAITAARRLGLHEARLHAQCHAIGFYARHGFRAEGPVFVEAGIDHRLMRLPLREGLVPTGRL
jgi:predicted GNAT family N-acyltransferase